MDSVRQARGGAANLSLGSKVIAVFMSLVLAIGLCPIAPSAKAYAAPTTTPVTVSWDAEQGSVEINESAHLTLKNGQAMDANKSAVLTLTATPEDDYEVNGFNITGVTPSKNEGNICTFKVGDTAINASPVFTPKLYDITLDEDIEYGTVTFSTAKAAKGTTVTLTPKPIEGYELDWLYVYKADDWNEEVDVEDNAFTMPAYSVAVYADFKDATKRSITVEEGINCATVNVSPTMAKLGEEVTITATPSKAGYVVDTYNSVVCNVDDAEDTRWTDWDEDDGVWTGTFNMPANAVSVKVVFVSEDDHSINCSPTIAGNGGTIEANQSTAKATDLITVTINESPNMALTGLYLNGVEQPLEWVDWYDDEGEFTFRMPDDDVSVKATFGPLQTATAPTGEIKLPWTGKEQTGIEATKQYRVDGGEATEVGNYSATLSLKHGYNKWNDNSTADKIIPWSIVKRPITLAVTNATYNGKEKVGVAAGVDADYIELTGAVKGTNAGTYTAKAKLKYPENTVWADDGTTADKTITWTIAKAQATAPTAVSGLVYNGKALTGVTGGANCTIAGTKTATDAGSYTATATANANYEFAGGKTTVSIPWSIAKQTIAAPKAKAKLTYNKKKQTGVAAGAGYTVTGNTGINAKKYTATATADKNHQFTGAKTEVKIAWSIVAAKNKLAKKLSKTYKTKALNKKGASFALPKATSGAATWKVSKKDAKKVLTLKKGKIQVKKGVKKGTYTIKLKANTKAGNYTAIKNQVVTVTVKVK